MTSDNKVLRALRTRCASLESELTHWDVVIENTRQEIEIKRQEAVVIRRQIDVIRLRLNAPLRHLRVDL